MPVIRACKSCGRKNRTPAKHLADTGQCGACKSPLQPVDEPLEVDPERFDEIIQKARVPVLVDFWAAWCGPCRMAAPEVARSAADMAGQAIVVKVDTERYPELAARFNVRGIPQLRCVFRRAVGDAASRRGRSSTAGELASVGRASSGTNPQQLTTSR